MPVDSLTQLGGLARSQQAAAGKGVKSLPAAGQGVAEAGGKSAPAPVAPAPSIRDVKQAVSYLNEYVQSLRRDLSFSVDEKSGHTIVRVVDSNTGELIRQIPAEEMVAVSRALRNSNSQAGILLQNQA
jgi:flagellar protein FlaG